MAELGLVFFRLCLTPHPVTESVCVPAAADVWLSVAPGLSGGLPDLPPLPGPAGDPGVADRDLLWTFGDLTRTPEEPPGDGGTARRTAEDETVDQLLQVRRLGSTG